MKSITLRPEVSAALAARLAEITAAADTLITTPQNAITLESNARYIKAKVQAIAQRLSLQEVASDSREWGVWCEVWGGVTGSRQAWLKADDGEHAWQATEAEAIVRAARLNGNANPRHEIAGSTRFRYTAKLVSGGAGTMLQ